MSEFGDGREERMAALDLELKLRMNPEVTRRREAYWASVKRAKEYASSLDKVVLVALLIEHNPAYIRDLLETEDERFGPGSLADRYAHTFYENFR